MSVCVCMYSVLIPLQQRYTSFWLKGEFFVLIVELLHQIGKINWLQILYGLHGLTTLTFLFQYYVSYLKENANS